MTDIYTDYAGDALSVGKRFNSDAVDMYAPTGGVHVKIEDLPELVAGLYRAAGLEPPILLQRDPSISAHGSCVTFAGVEVESCGGVVRVLGRAMSPSVARSLAALIVEQAEHAQAEPDPEEVDALAELVTNANWRDAEDIARVVLRAGYRRPEASE